LAENGKAGAVIVHHRYENQALALAEYLQKITGAEIPLVSEEEEVLGNQAAIVLALVDQGPGSSDRSTAQQAYRIHSRLIPPCDEGAWGTSRTR
jgi:hypothetical protein